MGLFNFLEFGLRGANYEFHRAFGEPLYLGSLRCLHF